MEQRRKTNRTIMERCSETFRDIGSFLFRGRTDRIAARAHVYRCDLVGDDRVDRHSKTHYQFMERCSETNYLIYG